MPAVASIGVDAGSDADPPPAGCCCGVSSDGGCGASRGGCCRPSPDGVVLPDSPGVGPVAPVSASRPSSRSTLQPGQTVRISLGIGVRSSPQFGHSVSSWPGSAASSPSASSITGVRSNMQIGQVESRSDGMPDRSAPQSGHCSTAASVSSDPSAGSSCSSSVSCVAQYLQKFASARTSFPQFGHGFVGPEGDSSPLLVSAVAPSVSDLLIGNEGCCHSPQLGFGHQPLVSEGSKCRPQIAQVASSGTRFRILHSYHSLR